MKVSHTHTFTIDLNNFYQLIDYTQITDEMRVMRND